MDFQNPTYHICLEDFLSKGALEYNVFSHVNNSLRIGYDINCKSTLYCPICFQICKSPCAPDSCAHFFCYSCLNRWKHTKRNCPYCRKNFKKIILFKN